MSRLKKINAKISALSKVGNIYTHELSNQFEDITARERIEQRVADLAVAIRNLKFFCNEAEKEFNDILLKYGIFMGIMN